MTRANRTDVYPEFPYFTPEERKRIDEKLKELEATYGVAEFPFQITPYGSTEFDRYDSYKNIRDSEIAAGSRRQRRREK